jgi:hypothetical protein
MKEQNYKSNLCLQQNQTTLSCYASSEAIHKQSEARGDNRHAQFATENQNILTSVGVLELVVRLFID